MKLIYEIYHKLKPHELRKLKNTFKHASFEYEKVGKLFELVTQFDEQEEDFYAEKIYQKPPDNTFRVTKSRLKRMMENLILGDKSLGSYKDKATNIRLQTRKKLLQGEILLGRGAYQSGKNLLQQVLTTSRKYDLMEEAFHAEMLLYRNLNIRVGVKDYAKHTQSLLELNSLRAAIEEARIRYYSVSNLMLNQTLKLAEKEEVRSSIERMKEISENTQHPQVRQLYLLSEIYFLQIDNRDQEALAFCHAYLSFIKENKTLHTQQREAIIYGQMAQAHLRIMELGPAGTYAHKALEMFSPEEMNYLRSLELCFAVAFYAKEEEVAQAYLDQAFSHPELEASPTIAARWHYFKACQLFGQEAFQDAYMELNHTTPLLADKHGMNLSIRLLEIMLLYELSHHDLMETKILNMRQFIKRTHKKDSFSRSHTLIQILIRWHRHHYEFGRTLSEQAEQFAQLRSAAGDHQMRGRSLFELIPLEQWMEEHI